MYGVTRARTAIEAMRRWMNNPVQGTNLLDGQYDHTGIALHSAHDADTGRCNCPRYSVDLRQGRAI